MLRMHSFGIGTSFAIVGLMSVTAPAAGQSPELDYGRQIYKRANCVGCHKWHGDGGGGYGGAALSLRATQLDRVQLVEVVRCGRPGTGMPFHDGKAYSASTPCYDFTSRADIGSEAPPQAAQFLSQRQIDGVVDYVLTVIKGQGEPTADACIAFWGPGSQNCRTGQ